jgi:hypothetical protein
MAATKLTLLVDKKIIERTKRYTKQHHTTISRLVSRLLEQLTHGDTEELPPAIVRLVGVLPKETSLDEHRTRLREKYKL